MQAFSNDLEVRLVRHAVALLQQSQDGRLTESAIGGCISYVRVALILHSLDRVDDGCEAILQQAPAVVGGPIALWVGDAVVGGAILGDCRPAHKAVAA